jgi:ABC-type multidrug transport system fused ATPase/permease subunit
MEEASTRKANFRKLMGFVRPFRRRLLFALALTILLTAIGMIPPLLVKYIVDSVIVEGNWGLLGIILGISILVPLVSAGLRLANAFTISYVSSKLIMDIRLGMYEHILSMSPRFHDDMGTGKLMSRIMGDVATVRSMVTNRLLSVVTDFVAFWVAIGLCLTLNWRLGLLLLVLLPLYILNYRIFIGGLRTSWRAWRRKMDDVSVGLQERLSGIQLVKAYGKERRENRAFVGDTRESLDHAMRAVVFRANQETGNWAVSGLRNTLVFCLGCYFVIEGEMTYGAVMAFQAYSMKVFQPVLNMTNLAQEYEQMMVSVDRIYEVLGTPAEVADGPDAIDPGRFRGKVEFEHVGFEYVEGEPVLKDICLEVEPGTVVALVGHTGCGKTTLTSTLMRYFDVKEGAIRIDGHDIRSLKVKPTRSQIGQVLQDSVIFNTTLRNNIRYGRPNVTEQEIMVAARVAEIHEFVMRTSDGYDTLVGDEGTKLSVGEKQRLAIARAVLTDPSILILDEATSSLDSISEALIQKAMANVLKGRTAFVIAHRLSTVVNADLIVVMDEGRIVEQGTHDELLEQPGSHYRALYERQFASLDELAAD